MKTNVIIASQDREIFGIIIPQETKTELLCVSKLQEAYDKVRAEKGWSIKRVADIIKTSTFIERCYYLLKQSFPNDEFLNTSFVVFKEYVDKEGILPVLKKYNWWSLKGKGTERSTWCNPYIWVSLALEFNPEIYAKVIKWLTDGLIMARIDAGTRYLPLTQSIQKYLEPSFPLTKDYNIYSKIAILINISVFGKHQAGIRDFCTKSQLAMISEAEQKIQALIQFQVIKNEKDVAEALKKIFS